MKKTKLERKCRASGGAALIRENKKLRAQLAEAQTRLAEAEETLEAIRSGAVDALVVARPEGDQVFTLEGAETTYRFLVEEMNEGALLLGPDGIILYANARFAQLAGVPLEQVIGASWEQFFVPAEQSRLAGLLTSARTASVREEMRLKAKTSSARPVGLSLCSMHREQMDSFSVVVTDLTERKAAEAALRAANENLESRVRERTAELKVKDSAIRSSITAIAMADLQGKLTYVNPAFLTLWGYEHQEEVLGKPVLKFWEEPERALEVVQTVRKGQSWAGELVALRKNGTRLTLHFAASTVLDDAGRPICLMASFRDITERRRAEELLLRSEARLAEAVKVSGLGIFEHDQRRDVLDWSPQLYNMFGFEKNKRVTVAIMLEQVVPEDREQVEQAIWRAHDPAGAGRFEFEYRILGQDGRIRWLSARSQTFFEGDGSERRAVRTIGAVRDITERKEFQVELERLVAERTARLEELVGELEHFSYTITHDMRAPLRAMKGYGEVVNELCADCPMSEPKDFLRRIMVSADRMDALIRDALNYSRAVRQELPLELVDTGVLLRGMLDSYPELQRPKANIQVDGELPMVMGNEAGLTQCFSNLLGNAVKFAKPGHPPEIRIWAEQRKGWARIWMEDKGVGIPKELLPRVFDMFARGQNTHGGTGIGLALVRKVMDRMEGRVGVESEEGKGSRFWLDLKLGGPRRGQPRVKATGMHSVGITD